MSRILLVEDELPIARAMKLKLEHEGFEVTYASDGEVGIEALSGDAAYDLVLLDLMMPKKNGFDVLEWIKEQGMSMPVFVLTNLSQQQDEEKVKALGAKEFIVKSNVPVSDIVGRIRDFLGSA